MTAPKLDRYGLHALDCECMRCSAGYRPTLQQRENARRAFEAAERRKKERERAEAEKAGAPKKRTVPLWEKHEAERRQTDEMLARIPKAAVVRPATAEELAELKQLWGFGPRGKDGKR